MSLVTEEPKTAEAIQDRAPQVPDPGSPRPPGGGSGNGGFGGGGRDASGGFSSFPVSRERLAVWLVLTGITMLFAGLASAYLVVRGSPGWQYVPLPSILWANTFMLLASSVTIERTRREVQHGRQGAARTWVALTAVIGLVFLVGQLVAWRQLVAAGVFLPSTPHGSFFYLLTGLHGLHLAGGVTALGYIWVQILRNRYGAWNHEPVALTAMYWHFMDGLWVCVFLLLILA